MCDEIMEIIGYIWRKTSSQIPVDPTKATGNHSFRFYFVLCFVLLCSVESNLVFIRARYLDYILVATAGTSGCSSDNGCSLLTICSVWVLKAYPHHSYNSPVDWGLFASSNSWANWGSATWSSPGSYSDPLGFMNKLNLFESLDLFTLSVSLTGDKVQLQGLLSYACSTSSGGRTAGLWLFSSWMGLPGVWGKPAQLCYFI